MFNLTLPNFNVGDGLAQDLKSKKPSIKDYKFTNLVK